MKWTHANFITLVVVIGGMLILAVWLLQAVLEVIAIACVPVLILLGIWGMLAPVRIAGTVTHHHVLHQPVTHDPHISITEELLAVTTLPAETEHPIS